MAPPRRVLRQQLEILVDFVDENNELLRSATIAASPYIRQKWVGIAKKLNAVESGVLKTAERWKKYWFEWKHKCKKKAADARRFQSGENRLVPLCDLELRVLELSGNGKSDLISKGSSQVESCLPHEDSDSQPLGNISAQSVPVRKIRPRRSTNTTSKSTFYHEPNNSEYEPHSATPPPKWALDIEERRIAAEERMAAALESIASVMQSQEERRAMLDQHLVDAITNIAGTVQDLNNGVQETLQHLHRMNPIQTNGPDIKENFII